MSIGVLVGRQTAVGTAAATLNTVAADFSSKLVKANVAVEEVRNGQDIHFAKREGVSYEEWTVGDSAVYHDTVGYWLSSAMGTPTNTAAGSAFTSVFKFTDAPNALTLKTTQPRRATEAYQIKDAVVDKMGFTFEAEGTLTYNVNGFGLTRATTGAPTFTNSTINPFVAWKGQVAFNGSALGSYAKLKKGSINITRNRKPLFTVNNSVDPNTFSTGSRMVEFDLTCDFASVGEYDKYRTAATDSLEILFTLTDGTTIGTPAASPTLRLKIGTAFIEDAEIDTGSDLPEITVKGKALYNATDASLAVVTLYTATNFVTAS
ncbi:hypothetical protein UFOVP570_47 [uncultured Caudovirales phage]|uniref:Uncharacterized protein n=1 Tax=uncultured Caudovirales phage TaxID=2100421 RepID=A0A6J5MZQ7_9CAUD|nr:hypothetical protein UFOVP570_47 [uncultured Caudovirales phage]